MFPWLEILFCIEVSKITSGISEIGLQDNRNSIYINEQYYTTLEVEAIAFDTFYVIYGDKTKASGMEGWTYNSFSTSKKIETGVKLYDIIRIGFRHVCLHPIVPYDYDITHEQFNAFYDEIYIKAEFKIK